jgi:hypothetical protein
MLQVFEILNKNGMSVLSVFKKIFFRIPIVMKVALFLHEKS